MEPDLNPTLRDISFLIGNWSVELSNTSFLPDPKQKIKSVTSFHWVSGQTALVMELGDRKTDPHAATWVMGRDEKSNTYTVLYSDKRGVPRVYYMHFSDSSWTMWRESPGFYQRFTGKVSPSQGEIQASWEKSYDNGKTWGHDYDLIFKRSRK